MFTKYWIRDVTSTTVRQRTNERLENLGGHSHQCMCVFKNEVNFIIITYYIES